MSRFRDSDDLARFLNTYLQEAGVKAEHCWIDHNTAEDILKFVGDLWEPEKRRVTAAIQALMAEPIFEDGKIEKGISVRYLMRMTMLKHEAGLDVPPAMVQEAKEAFYGRA